MLWSRISILRGANNSIDYVHRFHGLTKRANGNKGINFFQKIISNNGMLSYQDIISCSAANFNEQISYILFILQFAMYMCIMERTFANEETLKKVIIQ